ncbi:hypothetical protein [Zavarzinella formosa]|uniref:hypothetical protein n=1 Tax=Zavarzinella formosa TaxID=360055 RepID=UPI00031EC923|nr:hypothetical protein [Zavarzinella formosa]
MSWLNNMFSSNSSSRTRRRQQPRLGLECFEERTVPTASQITATLSGGTLTLTAQDAASVEDVALSDTTNVPGAITVSAASMGTTFKFGATTGTTFDFAGVKSISVFLKGGADSLNAQGIHLSGNLSINGGDGGNNITLSNNTFVGGTVTVTNGIGAMGDLDILDVNSTHIGKNLVINQGTGKQTTDTEVFGTTFIGGYISELGCAGPDDLSIQTTNIGSYLSLTGGLGDDQLSLTTSNVGSYVKAALGDGNNMAVISGSSVGGSVSVTTGLGTDSFELTNTTVGTTVTASMGEGNDKVRLLDASIGGATSVALGNGANSLDIDSNGTPGDTSTTGSFLMGNLTVTGGTGIDIVSLGSDKPVIVGGMTSMALGNEPTPTTPTTGDTVNIDDTTFLNTVNLDFGAGNAIDQLLVDIKPGTAGVLTKFADKLTVTMGGGDDLVRLGVAMSANNGVYFGVAPAIDGGTGDDTIFRGNGLIGGTTSITNVTNFFKNIEHVF